MIHNETATEIPSLLPYAEEGGKPMTRDEILAMEPGRELDILVAEKVFDWKDDGDACSQPEYSTDIAAAWEVVEKMGKVHGLSYTKNSLTHTFVLVPDGFGWYCEFPLPKWEEALGKTAPEAICKAALLAVMGDAK